VRTSRKPPACPVSRRLTKSPILVFLLLSALITRSQSPRTDILLNEHWRTIATDSNPPSPYWNQPANDQRTTINEQLPWRTVSIPHNWDDYNGYRRLRHGNRHGTAWYRKTFTIKGPPESKPRHPESNPRHREPKLRHPELVEGPPPASRRYFLFFEGVGSYATIWLNGHKAGYHAGGRTTFTLDITSLVYTDGRTNLLAVQADHPAFIKDLPWVCGGCSDERGFSEGSQPMGIFRPVHLISTNDIYIEPFGVHIWNDTTVSETSATLSVATSIASNRNKEVTVALRTRVLDAKGIQQDTITVKDIYQFGRRSPLPIPRIDIKHPHLWSPADPYLYTIVSEVIVDGRVADRVTTPYGIRTISWPLGAKAGGPFLINGKPFFINGIAEYEHLLGGSHAFTGEQVRSRVQMVKAAGFNAFRDAHQPHNLRYQEYWDKDGILWWPQLSAHVWYDTPAFKENFLQLLRDWVRERRNSPSLVLWGLQNESKLPAAFAAECTDIIRQMDPTASSQRKITTCNGGEGTDWDVPQNWTGTYGGNPATYAADLQKQVLVGEYGGWRTLDLHRNDPVAQGTLRSEDHLAQLMETKIRLADSVKATVAGHFFWLLTSHDNPGRVQGGEGWREIDRIGPVNYKGLFTPWEEPTDVFYMFRSNFVPAAKDPMVYIVSHTDPDRWPAPVDKDSIIVYSNCDEVELFNDIDSVSLGRRKRGGIGTHFQWNGIPIRYNILYAKAYVNGRVVARDTILLHHLPDAPHKALPYAGDTAARQLLRPQPGYRYLYRLNCGGDRYKDTYGNTWSSDIAFPGSSIEPYKQGSLSWTRRFPGLPPLFASQRRTNDIIKGTADWPLFQSFRYGRQDLVFSFPLRDGNYRVELYFIEPWINWAGGTGARLFDVAFNDSVVLHNLDIYAEAGHDRVLKKIIHVHVAGGGLVVSFPRVAAGQAVLSAIAITSLKIASFVPGPRPLLREVWEWSSSFKVHDWMNTGERGFASLPPALYGASWWQSLDQGTGIPVELIASRDAQVYIAIDTNIRQRPAPMEGFFDTKTFIRTGGNTGNVFRVWTKRVTAGDTIVPGTVTTDRRFIIAATPISNIEPAYDLKQATGYKAINATATPGIIKQTINGKPAMVFTQSFADTLQWSFQAGVADVYSLTIRYAHTAAGPLTARLQLLDETNHLLHEETVQLPPSLPGKWSYLNSSTGTMINAGSYRLRLLSMNAGGLAIDGLEVQ